MSFRFKQFFVEDDRCAMKVGTDGVLLGCWAPTSHLTFDIGHLRILDVGTGSGLIALMLAQRCPSAHIDAIDIDPNAIQQAKENFERSVFSHQLSAFNSSLQDWQNRQFLAIEQSIVNRQSSNRQLYDLVVSNPPYFRNSLKNPDKGRELARHTDTLSYDDLFRHSARLLNEHGQLALILPAETENDVRETAERYSLFITRVTRVYSKPSKPARRVLMTFDKLSIVNCQFSIIEDVLVLENETGGRSAAYQQLCQEFYL